MNFVYLGYSLSSVMWACNAKNIQAVTHTPHKRISRSLQSLSEFHSRGFWSAVLEESSGLVHKGCLYCSNMCFCSSSSIFGISMMTINECLSHKQLFQLSFNVPDVCFFSLLLLLLSPQDSQEKNANQMKAEEAKLKAKYPGLAQKPGGSDFLMKRLQKGVGVRWWEQRGDDSVNKPLNSTEACCVHAQRAAFSLNLEPNCRSVLDGQQSSSSTLLSLEKKITFKNFVEK